MSQPAFKALDLPFELVVDDGIPMDSHWQRVQMTFLIDLIHQAMAERRRTDFFVGGDMFVYYSVEQARDVAKGRPYFRGPDVFFVDGVEPKKEQRKAWVSWEEEGRLPDLIVELLSPSTAKIDRTIKKDLYARTFRTRDYFLYDLDTATLEGFHLAGDLYQPIRPDDQGRLRSEALGLDLGLWYGARENEETHWLRLFDADGRMVPASAERAQAERQRAETERQRAETEGQRAETERQRAETAEAEVARLRALLDERNPKS